MALTAPVIDVPPYRSSGTVYGTLLNHRTALAALGDAVHEAPYKAPPKAPVLYIKPRNTLAANGDAVQVPRDASELEVGACLGLVLGRTASRVNESDALDYLAGYVIVNDVSVPHASFYRPAIRHKARDGFCPLGSFAPRDAVTDPDRLSVRVHIDGILKQEVSTADLIRPVARLLADVTDFMTLHPGDVLAMGVAWPAPRVRAGQISLIEIAGVGTLQTPFVAADT